jgi:hypothetical protein
MRRRLRSLSAILAVAVLILSLIGPDSASAASGYQLDGTNPMTAAGGYCANGSYAFWSKNLYAGNGQLVMYVEVRYSPACGTNWVRTYDYTTVGASLKKIQRKASPAFSHAEYDTPSGWSYSMQVYAPGTTCIYIGASLLGEGGTGLGTIAYLGETKLC